MLSTAKLLTRPKKLANINKVWEDDYRDMHSTYFASYAMGLLKHSIQTLWQRH